MTPSRSCTVLTVLDPRRNSTFSLTAEVSHDLSLRALASHCPGWHSVRRARADVEPGRPVLAATACSHSCRKPDTRAATPAAPQDSGILPDSECGRHRATPIDGITLRDGKAQGERAPSRRYARLL